jgi:hypothetical protein
MHPLQMNALTSIFGSYLHPRDRKTSGMKISTKYLGGAQEIHLKQLHAKDGTLAWYYGLDALRDFNEFRENIPLP